MNVKDRMIMDTFRRNRKNYEALGHIVQGILEDAAKNSDILVMGIEHRVKGFKSLEGKLYKFSDFFQRIEDLTDLLGARVICYFGDDVDRFGKLIEKAFEIDWSLSSDKRALIQADRFGYLSMHYICSLPKGTGYPDELCDIKFEIQVKTILQHAWATIEHDLGYKSEFGVPRSVMREFARIAGLLEIADDEFMRARDHINEYAEKIREKIINDNADDVVIDLISLNEYMLRNKKMRAFIKELADIENSEISDIDPEGFIVQLQWLKIDTIGKLQDMFKRNSEVALELAKKTLCGSELDILTSTAALRFLCRAELATGGYTEEQATEFIALTMDNKERAARQARHLFKMYSDILEDRTE